MAKFKITILDAMGECRSEIVEEETFPYVSFPQHSLHCGNYGILVKIELLLESSKQNTIDITGSE